MIDVPLAVAVPLAAWVETDTLAAAPPVRLRVMALPEEPLATVWLTGLATGGARTVIVAVAAVEVPLMLVALYWKVSVPEKVALGV